ncbi:MAG: hypothetical protein CMM78_04845 [Rhodospirillaceae bacterium]|nr:hypothetical protein [Rhodospirillaceae bacterium]|tara:strand:+ start:154 stop:366 length:213 start_codon:yes stop_codon:yes gene_type:complete
MASYHLDTAKVVLNSAEILWRNIIETPAKTPAGIAAQVEAIRYFNGATPSDSIVSIGFETVLKSLQQLED